MEHMQHDRDMSASPKIGSRRRRVSSPERMRRSHRSCTPMSTTSPSRKLVEERVQSLAKFSGSTAAEDANFQVIPTPLDRSQRRRRQAQRESEKAKRQKDGKKAFYLSLDS